MASSTFHFANVKQDTALFLRAEATIARKVTHYGRVAMLDSSIEVTELLRLDKQGAFIWSGPSSLVRKDDTKAALSNATKIVLNYGKPSQAQRRGLSPWIDTPRRVCPISPREAGRVGLPEAQERHSALGKRTMKRVTIEILYGA